MTFPAAVLLCLVLVFLGAIIIGIFQIFRFIYREMGVVAVVIALGLSVGTPWLAWNRYANRHALSLVPAGLEVRSLTFKATELWGFGPGGAEEGLLVYELPEATARRIAHGGAAWLDTLQHDPAGRNANAKYSGWGATPVSGRGLPLDTSICQYDECAPLPPQLRQRVNTILASPGSYFARGRPGATIVVSPAERLVILRYGK